MKRWISVLLCSAGLLTGCISIQAATPTEMADKTAYDMTSRLISQRKPGDNLVLSPYSIQQILPLIGDNTTKHVVQRELKPYIVPDIRTEKLLNTKTGEMILLDKKLAPDYVGKADGDLKIVSYPNEALAEKEAFQKRILGSVIDNTAPTGNLSFYTAAHYYAEWATKFDKKLTENRPFIDEAGQVRSVMTMKKHFSSGIGKITPEYEMAAVYGKHASVVYFIKPERDAAAMANKLDSIVRDFEAGKGTVRDVDLEVPKISIKNKLDLNPLFQSMGLKSFYDGKLCFDKITGKDIPYVVDSAAQTATLDINEDYAEAKALTQVNFRTTSVLRMDVVHYIKMDKPYFIVIKDKTKSGIYRVVFTAFIANPK